MPLLLSCRLSPRQSAGEAAGGGHRRGTGGGEHSQEHHGTGPVYLGLLQRLPQLPAGLAGAGLCSTQPWPQSRGIIVKIEGERERDEQYKYFVDIMCYGAIHCV